MIFKSDRKWAKALTRGDFCDNMKSQKRNDRGRCLSVTSVSDITVVLPSLNPDEKLIKTVEGLIDVGFEDIVIINDGSEAEFVKNFPDKIKYPQCTLITHEVNRGKGAGLKTAFAFVREHRPESLGVVTADGDGQHSPEDVLSCALRMVDEKRVILGARNFNSEDIPNRSVFGNKLTSAVFRLLCGMKLTDTQTGLRAIPVEYLDMLLEVKGDRFEYETNMLLAFKDNDVDYAENPIKTVYIEENRTSHFHPLRDSVRIYSQILKYIFSSVSSTLIDLGAFALLFGLMFPKTLANKELCTLVCTVIARIISSLFNYFLNYRFVFAKKKKRKHTLVKYYLLVVAVMIVSGVSTAGFSALLPKGAWVGLITVIKAAVDTALFFATFAIQREWIFGGKDKNERNANE